MATVRYIRVSSTDRNSDRQYEDLPDTDKTFEEKASAATAERPQLQAMLEYISQGDHVYVASINRLARNIIDLHGIINQIIDKGATIHFIKERMKYGNEDNAAMQKLMLNMLESFAEFERELIRERQREGIAAAKAKGKRMGRPPRLTAKQQKEIIKKRTQGINPTQLAKEYDVSRGLIYKITDDRRGN